MNAILEASWEIRKLFANAPAFGGLPTPEEIAEVLRRFGLKDSDKDNDDR